MKQEDIEAALDSLDAGLSIDSGDRAPRGALAAQQLAALRQLRTRAKHDRGMNAAFITGAVMRAQADLAGVPNACACDRCGHVHTANRLVKA